MTSSEIPIWQEPVRGFYADPGQFLALSGLDFLRSEGSNLPPPIGYLCGLQLSAVEPGSTTFTMPVTDWLLSPQGAVSGATLSFLVDAPLGCTVQTALPPATPYSTAEITLMYAPGLRLMTLFGYSMGMLPCRNRERLAPLIPRTNRAARIMSAARSKLATASLYKVLLIGAVGVLRSRAEAQPAPRGPPAVGAIRAARQQITETNEFIARIQAVGRVAIVARVTAFLEKRAFVEGSEVKKGNLLYQLEQPPFQAQVDANKATIEQLDAHHHNAQIALQPPP